MTKENKVVVADRQDQSRFRIIDAGQFVEAIGEMQRRYPAGSNARYYAALELAGFEVSPRDDGGRYDVMLAPEYLAEIESQAIDHERNDDTEIAVYLRAHAAEVKAAL